MISAPFRSILSTVAKRTLSTSVIARAKTQTIDPQQEEMLKERCFVTDENDNVLGTASKRDCHTVGKDGKLILHRAFSVYLFNTKGDLLLQKRSAEKVTYPNRYTNSCCSHPIADCPGEEIEEDALGVKKAAVRKLKQELGIHEKYIPLDKFYYLTRIHYQDEGNGRWGEHEIDYILFLQGDIPVKPNPNEISEISYVPRDELDSYIPTLNAPLTPWFDLILKHRLRLWWDNLDNLDQIKDHDNILRLGFNKK